MFASILAYETKRGVFVLLFLSVLSFPLYIQEAIAESGWEQEINEFAKEISTKIHKEHLLFVDIPQDASQEKIYLPFTKQIQFVLLESLRNQGVQVASAPIVSGVSLLTEFNLLPTGLRLHGRVIDSSGLELSSSTISIINDKLPSSWDERSLQTVAYEIAGKIEQSLLGQKLDTLMVGLSGGKAENDTFISDFTVIMNGYMRKELGDLPSIQLKRTPEDSHKIHQLKGKFRIVGDKVYLNYTLTRIEDGGVVAVASTQFPLSIVPHGMSMYPQNRMIAHSFVDESNVDADKKIPVMVWVNHENAIYKDGDPLVVSIRPDIDAFVRVLYVQSDGGTCQIQPSLPGESSFLEGGKTYTIGGANDDVELIISDETKGQESIKVFASNIEILDRYLPTRFITGLNLSCIDGYTNFKRKINERSRGLKVLRRMWPVSEVNLLVK